jgi:hypothetical protein
LPRYFFHARDGRDLPDREGLELPSLTEVRAEALATAGELLRGAGDQFWNYGDWVMNVTDEAGETVVKLRFSADVT